MRHYSFLHSLLIFALASVLSAWAGIAHAQAVQIAAASSFRALWPALTKAYQSDSDNKLPIRVSFASSGLLTTQIRHGAPFDVFLSAAPEYTDTLHRLGKTQDPGITLALGTLSLVGHTFDGSETELSLKTAADILSNDSSATLAIANPRHAPYGVAAKQLLINSGIWPLEDRQILFAENASQALHYAQQRLTPFAIVPTSLIQTLDTSLPASRIDQNLYSPVEHRIVRVSNNENALHFYQWLQSKQAQQVLETYGFLIPQE